MLYNPNWTKENFPFDASLQRLISWLETKDPNETYDYNKGLSDHSECLLGQFLEDHGIERPYVGGATWNDCSSPEERKDFYLPAHFDAIARGSSAYRRDDWTFGDALARARSYLK
jgi:hypothetical protein